MESDDYFEAWEAQPKPRTYDEREERRLEKREKAAAKHCAVEMQSAENREGGALNKNAGTHRGAYGVYGTSKRSVQAKKKKLRDTNSGSLHISEDELSRQLAAIDATEAPSATSSAPKPPLAASRSIPAPRTVATMFAQQKRACALSLDDDIEEIISLPGAPLKRIRTDPPARSGEEIELSSSDELADEEEEPVPEQVEELVDKGLCLCLVPTIRRRGGVGQGQGQEDGEIGTGRSSSSSTSSSTAGPPY
ncbi:hypothetical protein B0H10DRAFT_2442130 [Mycena sp. CBHHK59/15]|nr:hypothetical protein B0H10DRAFT_2442130 [Mycena sp. CBHHK59/15]